MRQIALELRRSPLRVRGVEGSFVCVVALCVT
jgi:hypothetical protein